MNLVRDVLDKQLVDRTGRDCGKIDGLVLVSDAGQPPRLCWIECGSVTLAARLGRRMARAVAWLARWLGPRRALTEIHLGPAALLERLSPPFVSRRCGWCVRWEQIDLSDPMHPRLRVPLSEVMPLAPT